jgi:sugar phosphate isomerase/epimerase
MKIGTTTYAFDGLASFLGLGPSLQEKFKRIKSLGFDAVELLSLDLEDGVDNVRRWLDVYSLGITSVHAKPTEDVVKAMAALGGNAVIWPGTPFCNRGEAIEVAKQLDGMAAMAEPYGIKVGYHNHSHDFYFDEGGSLLEHVLDNSSKCFLQLDCGWAMGAGMYPPWLIRKYRNRIFSIHVKESSKVTGPGGRPISRHDPQADLGKTLADARALSVEERQKILKQIEAMAEAGAPGTEHQCKMGAPESNIDWREVKQALDEQDFEAFWIVERESFYGEHDKCLSDDCAWLKGNIE